MSEEVPWEPKTRRAWASQYLIPRWLGWAHGSGCGPTRAKMTCQKRKNEYFMPGRADLLKKAGWSLKLRGPNLKLKKNHFAIFKKLKLLSFQMKIFHFFGQKTSGLDPDLDRDPQHWLT
jgi:hypothetical protein